MMVSVPTSCVKSGLMILMMMMAAAVVEAIA